MAETKMTAKADALKDKAKLQQKQVEARMQSQKIKHMMKRPKPRVAAG